MNSFNLNITKNDCYVMYKGGTAVNSQNKGTFKKEMENHFRKVLYQQGLHFMITENGYIFSHMYF